MTWMGKICNSKPRRNIISQARLHPFFSSHVHACISFCFVYVIDIWDFLEKESSAQGEKFREHISHQDL